MHDFLKRLDERTRSKDRTSPLPIYNAPMGHGVGPVRIDGDAQEDPDRWQRPSVSPIPPVVFREDPENKPEYVPPDSDGRYTQFKHDFGRIRHQTDLADEIDELDRKLRDMIGRHAAPARETASAGAGAIAHRRAVRGVLGRLSAPQRQRAAALRSMQAVAAGLDTTDPVKREIADLVAGLT